MIYLIVAFISMSAGALESVSYIGFIKNHIGIPSYYIHLLSFILSFYAISYREWIKKSLFVMAISISAVYLALIFFETITYPNFVFSTTHINPFAFQFLIALFWYHAFIIRRTKWSKSLLIAGLIFVGVDGAGRTLGLMYKGLVDIARDPLATYPDKMTKVYPGFYPAMQEIIKLTSSDSTILIPPPGSPWDIEGNQAMVNYFLYPRTIINATSETDVTIPKGSNIYILVSKGTPSMFSPTNIYSYYWPKNYIHSKRIWKIDTQQNRVINYQRDFDPSIDKWDWGLIEVKNE